MLSHEVYLLLVQLTKALTVNNIKYWLDGGSLLGIYRQQELIDYDHDMDLGLYEESFEGDNRRKIVKIMNNLNWVETDNYSHKMQFNYSGIHIDFFKFLRTTKYWYHNVHSGYTYYSLECLDSLKEYNCNGDIFMIPNNAKKYLEDTYGDTWLYPNPNFKKPRDYNNWVQHFNEIEKHLKRKIIIFDVDGTLTEPKKIMTEDMKDFLIRLSHSYIILILDTDSCKRIYNKLNKLDNIIFYGNYGLECAIGCRGILKNIYKEKVLENIDKSYGISKILNRYIKYTKKEIYYIGDDWHKYGNDIAVLKTGIKCVQVNRPVETIKVISYLCVYRESIETREIPGRIYKI